MTWGFLEVGEHVVALDAIGGDELGDKLLEGGNLAFEGLGVAAGDGPDASSEEVDSVVERQWDMMLP